MNATPIGVLLMAYGSPNSLDEVEDYYTDIRRGRKPPPELLAELIERYRVVGGRTPLLAISRAQAAGLQTVLGPDYQVFLGMKHWHPYIKVALAEMQSAGIRQAVGVVLAPHYSRGSIGEYVDRIEKAKAELDYDLAITVVPSWHLNPHYLTAVAQHVRERLPDFGADAPVTVVFSAHSLPERVVAAGDPYREQMFETSRALAEMLGLEEWGRHGGTADGAGAHTGEQRHTGQPPEGQQPRGGQSAGLPLRSWVFTFQSAGRTADPWLDPDIVETVEALADDGVRNILVAPIGFIADHLEIFYDIDVEATEAAHARGVRLERIRSLNDDPELIAALADVVHSTTMTEATS